MSELVEAVQRIVRREVAQMLRQAADTIDGNGQVSAKTDDYLRARGALPRDAYTPRAGVRVRPRGVGFRHQQVLDLLRKHPEGLAGSDISERCGMHGTSQVYGVLKRLQRDGKVKKRGKGYVAV